MKPKRLTWGDTVKVRLNADPEKRPGAIAEVCGMRDVETDDQSEEFSSPIGTKLYLIEFEDGSSIEIPEGFLESYIE